MNEKKAVGKKISKTAGKSAGKAVYINMIISMVAFGTIGLFVRNIDMPSSCIAMVRGYVGALFLLIVLKIRGRKIEAEEVRRNLLFLVLSGAAIGFNWILLFEAYRYTTIACATLAYYMQPVFVTIASVLILKEKTSAKKLLCVAAAVFGMVLISGIFSSTGTVSIRGILLGLGAGALYASVILMNKQIKNIDSFVQTMSQLFIAALVATPYVALTVDQGDIGLNARSVILLLTVSIVHTGICYVLFFGSIPHLPAQTAAILTYVDPVTAVILSALFLGEPLGLTGIVGAVLIIGSALAGEVSAS